MISHDWIVGGVACGLGGLFIAAALLNWNGWFEMPKTRWLTERFGRRTARFVFIVGGAALAALGLAIGMGFRWQLF